jgi:hypothetical protein
MKSPLPLMGERQVKETQNSLPKFSLTAHTLNDTNCGSYGGSS